MSDRAIDLLGLLRDDPQSLELRRIAGELIAVGVRCELGGC